ncbi:sigma-54-dependent transcriptional regulator [Ectopseudomonas guguanensis]|uniref:sigma-54-dependent transcriptional regulator n=1 Tax=Ectopseudomonas guguanensis TaxID=1198456 RepID=UPI0039C2CE11
MEAVSVVSRRLLVLEPFAACAPLIQPLQVAGWTLQRCTPETFTAQAGDALLLHLDEHPGHGLRKHLQRTGLACVALANTQRLESFDMQELIGEWLFAVLPLPVETPRLLEALQQAQAATRLRRLKSGRQALQFLGNSGPARSLRKQIDRLSRGDAPLLIRGERGSGKHLLARLLHQHSARRAQAMRHIDCAEVFDDALMAASSATTLLLENVAALPTAAQQRMLGYLQAHPRASLVALDQGALVQAVQQERFDSALFGLLSAQQVDTPNLREHPGDLLLLAEHFARQHGASIGRHHRHFGEDAISAMTAHPWPGNVRELRHRVLRALVLAQGRQILAADLGLQPVRAHLDTPVTLEDYILRAERQALNDVLGRYTHNMSQAARTLGISRPTFYRLLHKHRLR